MCGERFARRFTAQPLSLAEKLRRRWRAPDVAAVLEAQRAEVQAVREQAAGVEVLGPICRRMGITEADIDTPDDYARLLAEFGPRTLPY